MNLLGSKSIETNRLIIRATEERDLYRLYEILKIDDVNRYYLTSKFSLNWEDEKKWQYKKLEQANNNDVFQWSIEVKEDSKTIGQVCVFEKEDNNKEIRDVGWFLDPNYQKKGYAYEAVFEILKFMFFEVGITEIRTCAATCNPNSWKLMEKLGFKRLNTTSYCKYTFLEEEVCCYDYYLDKDLFLKECSRKDDLHISIDIDKEPYLKKISDDLVLNVTGESGSGKSTIILPYKSDSSNVVIDTDMVFGKALKDKDNLDVYNMFIDKYGKLPNLINDFDKIYCDIVNYYKNSGRLLIIDSAQFRNIKDISLLRGEVLVLRTCINTCYFRCLERYEKNNKDATAEMKFSYQIKKKGMYTWYHSLNRFLDRVDSLQ